MFQGLKDRLLRRVVAFVVTGALAWLAAKWPHFPLPSPETTTEYVTAVLMTWGTADLGRLLLGRKLHSLWESIKARFAPKQ